MEEKRLESWVASRVFDVRATTARLGVAIAVVAGTFAACSSTDSATSADASAPGSGGVPRDAGAGSDGNESPPVVAQPECRSDPNNWPMFGQNLCNTGSSPAGAGMSKSVAKRLAMKWVYDAPGDVSATPAVVDGYVYVPDWSGMINKLDATTGKVVWSKSVTALMAAGTGTTLVGFNSRTTPIVTSDSVIFGTGRDSNLLSSPGGSAFVVSIDKNTAAVKWVTPVHEGHPAAVVTGSAVYDGTRIYFGVASSEEAFPHFIATYPCCSFRGSIVAVDAATGSVVWQTHTISDRLYYMSGTASDGGALSGYAGLASWSSAPVVDLKRKQLYATLGNNYATPSGAAGFTPDDPTDSIIALDLDTGTVKWTQALPAGGKDVWTFINQDKDASPAEGVDSDFGSGANLFTAEIDGAARDLVGAGQKSGIYYALDPDTGSIVWKTQVGPGGHLGGIHWGTATDGNRIYVAVNDTFSTPWTLAGKGAHAGETVTTGAWSALDPATGKILWQTPDPALAKPLDGTSLNGPITVVNGVVFGGSMDAKGTMFAVDADSGDVIWSFQSGGTVYGGAAIAGGVVYWGSGYTVRIPAYIIPPEGQVGGFGTSSKKLYAFAAP